MSFGKGVSATGRQSQGSLEALSTIQDAIAVREQSPAVGIGCKKNRFQPRSTWKTSGTVNHVRLKYAEGTGFIKVRSLRFPSKFGPTAVETGHGARDAPASLGFIATKDSSRLFAVDMAGYGARVRVLPGTTVGQEAATT